MIKKLLISFFILTLSIGGLSATDVSAKGLRFNQKSLTELAMGKENDHVKFLQQSLYDFGYYKSEEDEPVFSGKYEKDLTAALKDFQQTNELKVTGKADQATLKTLNEFLDFQEESEEEDKVPEKPVNAFMDEGTSASDTMVIEEAKYFDQDEVTDIYTGVPLRQRGGVLKDVLTTEGNSNSNYSDKEARINDYEQKTEEKKETFIESLIGSLKKLFMPSTYFRNSARSSYEKELSQEKVEVTNDAKKDLDFFDCVSSDDCLEELNKNDKTQK